MLRRSAAVMLVGWMVLGSGWGLALGADEGGWLRWEVGTRRVAADIPGWTLQRTLQAIADQTRWSVYVEPGLKSRVAARFEGRPQREALAALLSDVNFALIPSTHGQARLLVFRSASSEATEVVRPKDGEEKGGAGAADEALGKEWVVRLKKGAKLGIDELARRLGARVAGSIEGSDAHRLVFEDEAQAAAARSALEANEEVASVESNYRLEAPTQIQTAPGATVPGLGIRARPLTDGSSVVVALLDTAVAAGSVAHPEFLLPGASTALETYGGTGGASGLSHGSAMFETLLQGLAITEKAAGGETPVRVLPIDIYGGRGETSTFELAQGIAIALEKGADILNLSLSGPTSSPLVEDLIRQATAAGVLTFAAPGNEPTVSPTYPAAYPEVIAVTASGDRPGQVAPYANRGSFIDLIAPGTSLVPYSGETWVIHGTSVSTAYAAGLAAGLLSAPSRTPTEALAEMRARMSFQAGQVSSP